MKKEIFTGFITAVLNKITAIGLGAHPRVSVTPRVWVKKTHKAKVSRDPAATIGMPWGTQACCNNGFLHLILLGSSLTPIHI